MKKGALLILLYILCINPIYAQSVGSVIYKSGFDVQEEAWINDGTCKARYTTKDGNTVVKIKKGILKLPIQASAYAGTKIAIKFRLKSDGITEKPKPWNGIKLMLHIPVPWDDIYLQTDVPTTAFDWTEIGLTAFIPPEADTVWLCMGLENVTGRVWFDNVEVSIAEAARTKPSVASLLPVYKGHNEKRLRGMMISPDVTEADLRALATWGANHVRWQLTWGGFPFSNADTASEAVYVSWLEGKLQHLDRLLPVCRELGLKVLIDLHTLPGGRNTDNGGTRLFLEKRWQEVFTEVWKNIANRYKNEDIVWGYDLANEPDDGAVPDGVMNWWQLASFTAKEIRLVDTVHAIIIEGAPRGGPEALARLQPIPVNKVVYSFHMYVPAIFTHQGINFNDISRYPGIIQNREWNIKTIRKTFEQVRKWQLDYNAHIYVGEFSTIRWAPGESAYYYLRDCIELFEEYGWDWAYHAFREWNGWSVEHTEDKDNELPATVATERQKLLMKYFAKNKE